jgi:hypothetical protein
LSKGGHTGANGVVEVLLTGNTAEKAKAAALAALPPSGYSLGSTVNHIDRYLGTHRRGYGPGLIGLPGRGVPPRPSTAATSTVT